MREKVRLQCTECMSLNYTILKKKGDPKRYEMTKYCPACGKHTVHRETK